MTADELQTGQRVRFTLAGELMQGVVVKGQRVAIMRDPHRCGDWRPIFVSLSLLGHVKFHHLDRATTPIYNSAMEELLRKARLGDLDF